MQASHHARCPTAAAHPCSPPPPTVSLFSPPASVLFRRIQAVNGSSKPDKTKVSTSRTTKDGEKYPGADFQAAILSAPFQAIEKNRLSNPHASSLLTANRPGDKPEPPALPGLLAKSETLSSDRLRCLGLSNLGSTCYMNTVLQALYHSLQLRSEVLASRPSLSRPHLAALQRVFAFLAFSERPAYSPEQFQQAALPPWFERGRQHDCSEFLRYLLDVIQEEERLPVCRDEIPAAQPAIVPRSRDDTVVLSPAVADRRLSRRRRNLSCSDSPKPGSGSTAGDSTSAADSAQPQTGDGGGLRSAVGTGAATVAGSQNASEDGAGIGGAAVSTRLVLRLMTGSVQTSYTCCACGTASIHVDRLTDLQLPVPESPSTLPTKGGLGPGSTTGPPTAVGEHPMRQPSSPTPQWRPSGDCDSSSGPRPRHWSASEPESTSTGTTEKLLTVSDLLQHYLTQSGSAERISTTA